MSLFSSYLEKKKCDFLSSVLKEWCHSFLQMLLKLQIQLCQILIEKKEKKNSNSYIRFDFLCQHVSDIVQLCFLTFWIWASFVGHEKKKKKEGVGRCFVRRFNL